MKTAAIFSGIGSFAVVAYLIAAPVGAETGDLIVDHRPAVAFLSVAQALPVKNWASTRCDWGDDGGKMFSVSVTSEASDAGDRVWRLYAKRMVVVTDMATWPVGTMRHKDNDPSGNAQYVEHCNADLTAEQAATAQNWAVSTGGWDGDAADVQAVMVRRRHGKIMATTSGYKAYAPADLPAGATPIGKVL